MLVPGLKKRSRICFEYFCTYRVTYCVLSFMRVDIFRDLTFSISFIKYEAFCEQNTEYLKYKILSFYLIWFIAPNWAMDSKVCISLTLKLIK